MRLRPRHYALIAILLGIGIFNYTRSLRGHQKESTTQVPAQLVPIPPPGTSPAWPLYDQTARLRDAPDSGFQPALKSLASAIDASTATDDLADLHGCQTWLLFYRQEHLHPAVNKPGWAQQLQSHVNSCVASHRDISQ